MNKLLHTSALFLALTSSLYAENTITQVTTPAEIKPSTTSETPAIAPQPAIVDCHLKIPASTVVTQELVSAWSEKAVEQSFNYSSLDIDSKLLELKSCFTDQGWLGYNDAITQSGNIKAVKEQKLTVSSQIDGKTRVETLKDNNWKVRVLLQVVYQNDKEKLTQLLTVDLMVARKVSGELGILQIIAAPRGKATES